MSHQRIYLFTIVPTGLLFFFFLASCHSSHSCCKAQVQVLLLFSSLAASPVVGTTAFNSKQARLLLNKAFRAKLLHGTWAYPLIIACSYLCWIACNIMSKVFLDLGSMVGMTSDLPLWHTYPWTCRQLFAGNLKNVIIANSETHTSA